MTMTLSHSDMIPTEEVEENCSKRPKKYSKNFGFT